MSEDFDPTSFSHSSLAALLAAHILAKGYQAGGILAVPVAPLYSLLRKRGWSAATLLGIAGGISLATTAATAALGALKFTQLDRAGFEDRCYRLYHNAGQVRTDKFSVVGSALGLAAAAYLVPKPQLVHYVGGAAYGSAAAIGLHLLTSKMVAKSA